MCVALKIRIKGATFRSPLFANVGCGKCEECRAVYKSGWAFRINAQFQPLIDAGWKMCFFTLTYRNEKLPTLPENVFKNPDYDYWLDSERCNSRGIICFSRDDIESFTHHMRDWFLSCGVVKPQYFICSEFGDTTQRSHYHGIFVTPPNFDNRALFNEIKRFWADGYYYLQGHKTKYHESKGFLFPRYYEGGKDEYGYVHKPFVVESPNSAMRYIAKYVTKDLAFLEYIQSNDIGIDKFDTKCRTWRRCMPFHVQTRSLGCNFLDKLTDEEKLVLLEKGASFLGDNKKRAIPSYIREKILFNPYYIKKYGRRFVRRCPTPFMQENFDSIFDIKCRFQDSVFKRNLDWSTFKECGASYNDYRRYQLFYECASEKAKKYGGLSAWKVAYYGQSLCRSYFPWLEKPSLYWIERYRPSSRYLPYHLSPQEKADFEFLRDCVSELDFIVSQHPKRRTFLRREIDKTRDYWKHILYNTLIA